MCKPIKEIFPDLDIIMLTSYEEEDNILKAIIDALNIVAKGGHICLRK